MSGAKLQNSSPCGAYCDGSAVCMIPTRVLGEYVVIGTKFTSTLPSIPHLLSLLLGTCCSGIGSCVAGKAPESAGSPVDGINRIILLPTNPGPVY